MDHAIDEFLKKVGSESQVGADALGRLFSSGDAAKVFSQPVTSGDYTVITACEVGVGGGFGSGMGFSFPKNKQGQDGVNQEGGSAGAAQEGGGGSGGGGGSMGRPVAAIVIGPNGVEVKPLLDMTKIMLALFTGVAAMLGLLLKILKR